MGRRKSARELEKQLEYARKREAYKAPDREDGSATRRRPKLALAYKPMAIAAGEGAKKYKVQASKEAVQFFTQTALNLTDATVEENLPRGAQPAKVQATVSEASPELVRARGSGRPYIHYGKGARGSGSQYSYSAPFSIQSVSAMDTEITSLFNSVKSRLGGPYGRVWYTPERFIIADSGE